MLAQERRNRIIQLINEQKSVLVAELAQIFRVTEETIRRDLERLESQGVLTRTYGGALLSENLSFEMPVEVRQVINTQGKNLIAQEAAKLVTDGDTIMLDASTSCLFLAMHLKALKGLTVITNSGKIIQELSDCLDINLISTGGIYERESLSFIGRSAQSMIGNYNAKKCFVSCKGFTLPRGLTVSSEPQADIKRAMIAASDKTICLIDHTKLTKVGFATIMNLDELECIITDQIFDEESMNTLKGCGVEVIVSK